MNLSGGIKKIHPFLFPLAFVFLIDLFSVRATYQRCTCPELLLIDPIESVLLKWKYRRDVNVKTFEVYSETDLSPGGPSPTFTTMTHFGYYLAPKCEEADCKIKYPNLRILFSIPTFLLLILEAILFFILFRFLKTQN